MTIWYRLFVLINVVLTTFAQNDYCREGTYGNNCELTCPDQCRPLQTFPCDKRTGRCAEGCNSGYYGDQCNKQCFCSSGICFQANGECYGTGTTNDIDDLNTTNRVGSTTEAPVRASDCEAVEGEWFIIAIILIILIIILIGLVVLMLLYRRWEMKQSSEKDSGRNQRRFLGIVPPFLACFGGRDSEADIPENVPLNTANVSPIQEENNPEAADKLGETQTQDQQGDRPLIESGESKERELKQRIKELEQECCKLGESKEKQRQSISKLEDELTQKNPYKVDMTSTGVNTVNTKRQIEEKYVAELNETLKNLGLPPNSTNHLMKANKMDTSIWLQCPHLKFDTERVNVKVAQVDDKMVLWNIPDPRNPVDNSRRFQQFSGTTCTDPLVRTGLYQYFEAIFNIDLNRSFGEGEVVMQLGFCGENDQDGNKFIQGKKGGVLLKAVGCNTHKTLCLVLMQGDKAEHLLGLMKNSVGTREEVNIGIRLNKEMRRIKVYDFRALKLLKKKIDIRIGERIWPMFGLCAEDEASVSVKLQAGRDIKIWDEKRETLKPKEKLSSNKHNA